MALPLLLPEPVAFIEDDLIKAFEDTLQQDEFHHPYGGIILQLFRNPSLDPVLHKGLASYISVKRRQGNSIDVVCGQILAFTPRERPLWLVVESRWFLDSYLKLDPALYGYRLWLNVFVIGAPRAMLRDKALLKKLLEKDPSLVQVGLPSFGDDLALIAFSGPRASVVALLEDRTNYRNVPGYAYHFHRRLREQLDTHDIFCKIFLYGWTTDGTPIALLRQGLETSTKYRKVIAEFLGVLTGKDLRRARQADETLVALKYLVPDPGNVPGAPRRNSSRGTVDVLSSDLVLNGSGHHAESPDAPINRRGPLRPRRPPIILRYDSWSGISDREES